MFIAWIILALATAWIGSFIVGLVNLTQQHARQSARHVARIAH